MIINDGSHLLICAYMIDRAFEDTVIPNQILSGYGKFPAMTIDVYHTAEELLVKSTFPGYTIPAQAKGIGPSLRNVQSVEHFAMTYVQRIPRY